MSVQLNSRSVKIFGAIAAACIAAFDSSSALESGAESARHGATRTPIEHLIVVVGENRGFDNVFGAYVPPDPTQTVWNLLSLGIVDRAGLPGPNAALARQQQATDTSFFQLAPPRTGAPSSLPQPSTTLNALPASPCLLSQLYTKLGKNPSGVLFCTDTGLLPLDQILLSKGGTGQLFYDPTLNAYPVPDCRYPTHLPNAPYSLVGASTLNHCPSPPFIKPVITPTQFSDNTGDPVHRFFQMWQQNDCRSSAISRKNPSGCLGDLYVWVATSVGWQITRDGKPPTNAQATFQGSVPMGFYNMAAGDYPYFRSLADKYAINDNYHQFIMGGTGANSQSILTADVYYFTDSKGNPGKPPAELIENPNPRPGSNNFYTHAAPGAVDPGNTSTGGLVNCSDMTQPGVKAIRQYLRSLPYRAFNDGNCAPGRYYQVDNEYPSYNRLGGPNTLGNEFPAGPAFAIGPQTIPTIGDALAAKGVSWKYYGGGFNRAADPPLANSLYCAICNGFQYSRSIMTGPLKNNLKDFNSFLSDVRGGALPAVSFVKPDLLLDSHPGTSTPPLFEAFVKRVVDAVQKNQSIWRNTAILITFDEAGGYYDSGYIQPIDFFGDGPRTVMIAISPYAKTGKVDHTYSDHASIVKFIERNWNLKPLSSRSRDNLPNPIALPSAPYFPTNKPAIGDLMNMFDFPHASEH
ncbi:phosphoesterase [Methylocystis sp. WRRC1]|uniref:alkaline phosphatase family protein n=1 Tax=Methylocystis sp. WRRC1 TaxID=1732014 RepID=UPI001D133323|nr:alkaline phosphatase family protein [Methylocystis sp. WRRC1]MCC3245669.1 phosphoesterase [Methylocystis sp. WRRC1]